MAAGSAYAAPVSPARKASREDKRRRIIDAAVEVFADKGFFSARVSEIADAAGVADGTIYLYFKSKDEILLSLFREKMGEIIQRFQAMIAQLDEPEDQLRHYIAEHLALVEAQPKLMQVLTVEVRQSARFMKEQTPPAFGRYLALLASVVEHGQRRGVFRAEISPILAARAIFGAVDELALAWVLGGSTEPLRTADIAAELSQTFLRGLRTT